MPPRERERLELARTDLDTPEVRLAERGLLLRRGFERAGAARPTSKHSMVEGGLWERLL